MPILKRSIVLLKVIEHIIPYRIQNLIKHTQYNYKLIEKDCILNRIRVPIHERIYLSLKRFRKKIISIRLKEHKVQIFGKTYQFN